MESDYWNVHPHSFLSFPTNLVSASSKNEGSVLAPRLRRYVHEIGDAVSRVLQDSSSSSIDAVSQFSDASLVRAEQHFTVPGLQRQLVALQLQLGAFKKENASLSEKVKEAEALPSLRAELKDVQEERDQLKASVEQLRQEMEKNLQQHSQTYDELHLLFQNLTEQSSKTALLCDQRRLELERQEAERLSLAARVEMLESERDATAKTHRALHDQDRHKIEELVNDVSTLQRTLAEEKEKKRYELDELRQRYDKTLEKRAHANETLTRKIHELQAVVAELRETGRESEVFLKEKRALQTELRSLRDAKDKCAAVEKRLKETEAALTASRAKEKLLTEHQSTTVESNVRHFIRQLEKWKEAAMAGNDALAADPQPGALKAYLLSVENQRSRTAQIIRRLTEENARLNAELGSGMDELRRVQLELNEQRLRTAAAEFEAAVLTGELRSQQGVRPSLGNVQTANPHSGSSTASSGCQASETAPHSEGVAFSPRESQDTSSSNLGCKILQVVENFNKDKTSFINLISEYKTRMHEILREKENLTRKAGSACSNFSGIELMLEQAKAETQEKDNIIQQQSKTIASLKAKASSFATEDIETLRRERDEAAKLAQMTREFYRNEAILLRAIIKALLGWHIQIDMAPVGEDITVTLRPALTPVYQDDAALIFRVTSKLPSLRTEDLPKDVIEEEISRLFRDEDFDMHLDGRFADKWDTDADWKNQLSARCSYAAFLAVTILAEQNHVLQCSALLSARRIRNAKHTSVTDQPASPCPNTQLHTAESDAA